MKMRNTVPRPGIEPTSLAFWTTVLVITPRRLPWCHHYTRAFLSMQLLAWKVSADYYIHPLWNCKSFNAYNYIQIMALHKQTQGMFNNHTTHSLYMFIVMTTSVVGVMKMGNTLPRAGIEPTSQAFRASVLTIIPVRRPWCRHYTHAYLSMQILASEVSAAYCNTESTAKTMSVSVHK